MILLKSTVGTWWIFERDKLVRASKAAEKIKKDIEKVLTKHSNIWYLIKVVADMQRNNKAP